MEIKKLRRYGKEKCPKPIWQVYMKMKSCVKFIFVRAYRKEYFLKYKYRERKVSYGSENPNKTFYVIRSLQPYGIFSKCIEYIKHLEYCEMKQYIPVIDDLHIGNSGMPELLGKINTWEIFFKQPGGYTLDEIRRSKNVILCNALAFPKGVVGLKWLEYDMHGDASKWNKIFDKYYIYSDEVKEYIKNKEKEIWKENKKILGVSVRRGIQRMIEQGQAIASGHPIEYTVEEVITLVKKKVNAYDYIYIMSDDEESIGLFQQQFQDKCIFLDRVRMQYYKNNIPNPISNIELSKQTEMNTSSKQRILDYIVEVDLLARCHSVIVGRNGGTIVANIKNDNKYRDLFVAEHGISNIRSRGRKMIDGQYIEMEK